MSLECILLAMIREPAAGYDLRKEFAQGARHFWSAELSQIYPTLERMERRGWLKSRRQASQKGPQRRVYRRTAKGAAALHRWLRSEPVMGTERFAYIAQLAYMASLGDLRQTERFLGQLRDCLFRFQKLLEDAEGALAQERPRFPDDLSDEEFHSLLTLRIGIRSLRAKVDACDEGLNLIAARQSRLTKDVPHVPLD